MHHSVFLETHMLIRVNLFVRCRNHTRFQEESTMDRWLEEWTNELMTMWNEREGGNRLTENQEEA